MSHLCAFREIKQNTEINELFALRQRLIKILVYTPIIGARILKHQIYLNFFLQNCSEIKKQIVFDYHRTTTRTPAEVCELTVHMLQWGYLNFKQSPNKKKLKQNHQRFTI